MSENIMNLSENAMHLERVEREKGLLLADVLLRSQPSFNSTGAAAEKTSAPPNRNHEAASVPVIELWL
jgi:hypothetical protein